MIDLILLLFSLATFAAGFWVGKTYLTAEGAWKALNEWFGRSAE